MPLLALLDPHDDCLGYDIVYSDGSRKIIHIYGRRHRTVHIMLPGGKIVETRHETHKV